MNGKWIGAALAACLAAASPAQADHRNDGALAAAFVFGVATLLLLDEALEDDRGDRREPGRVTRRRDWHHETYREDNRRLRPHRRRGLALPSACLGTYETRRHGEIRIVGERCLRRNASLLPHVCRSIVTGPRGGDRAIYRVGCLRDNGYRFY